MCSEIASASVFASCGWVKSESMRFLAKYKIPLICIFISIGRLSENLQVKVTRACRRIRLLFNIHTKYHNITNNSLNAKRKSFDSFRLNQLVCLKWLHKMDQMILVQESNYAPLGFDLFRTIIWLLIYLVSHYLHRWLPHTSVTLTPFSFQWLMQVCNGCLVITICD